MDGNQSEIRCTNCGAPNAAGSQFCSNCGGRLMVTRAAVQRPAPWDKNVVFLVLGLLSFVLGAVPNRWGMLACILGAVTVLVTVKETGWRAYISRILGLCGCILGLLTLI